MNPARTGGGRGPRRLRSADAPPVGTSMPQYVQTGAAVFQRPHLRMRPFLVPGEVRRAGRDGPAANNMPGTPVRTPCPGDGLCGA